MSKTYHKLSILAEYLPEGSFPHIEKYFATYAIEMVLARDRKTLLGNYRPPLPHDPRHRISVNANLDPYTFLVTLLHEFAHMLTYIEYGRTVMPHGKEWQQKNKEVLAPYLEHNFFPPEVAASLTKTINSTSISACMEDHLSRALMKYNKKFEGSVTIDSLPMNALFSTDKERRERFIKLEKVRTRFRCRNISNNRLYTIPAHAPVWVVEQSAT